MPQRTNKPPRATSGLAGGIWVAVVAIVLAAAAVGGFLLWQQWQQGEARAQYSAAVNDYEAAWDGLQSQLTTSQALADDADTDEAQTKPFTELAAALTAAAGADRLETPQATEVPPDDLERRTAALESGTRELAQLSETLTAVSTAAADAHSVQQLEVAKEQLERAITRGQSALDAAAQVDDLALLAELENAVKDGRALLKDETAQLDAVRAATTGLSDLAAEVETAIGAAVPKREDVNGQWCGPAGSVLGCFTVDLPQLTTQGNSANYVLSWTDTGDLSGCMSFSATQLGTNGGFAMVYCPAGTPMPPGPGENLSASDDVTQDRFFAGQGSPMEMYTRKR